MVTQLKHIALTRQNFVGKIMSLLFNMLSRLVITFLISQSQPFGQAQVQRGEEIRLHLSMKGITEGK